MAQWSYDARMRDFQDRNMQKRDQRWKEEKSEPANAKAAQLHDSTRTKAGLNASLTACCARLGLGEHGDVV
jgi:hypothetical protein